MIKWYRKDRINKEFFAFLIPEEMFDSANFFGSEKTTIRVTRIFLSLGMILCTFLLYSFVYEFYSR
jgi:hypothetical protein